MPSGKTSNFVGFSGQIKDGIVTPEKLTYPALSSLGRDVLTVAASAITSTETFTDDGTYQYSFSAEMKSTAAGQRFNIRLNGDSTASNYYVEHWNKQGTAAPVVTDANSNNITLTSTAANDFWTVKGTVTHGSDGHATILGEAVLHRADNTHELCLFYIRWNNTANLARIGLASAADFKAGSWLRVFECA